MTRRYVSCADTAKLLRENLKTTYPGVKFSVRSKTYSGGASIDVRWTDGPAEGAVQETAWLYRGATFDGMTDMKSYHDALVATPDGAVEAVHFGADFIFCNREHSTGFLAALEASAIPVHDSHGSACYLCCRQWTSGFFFPKISRARSGCSPECAAKLAARFVDAETGAVIS